jgi:hypothetical protein
VIESFGNTLYYQMTRKLVGKIFITWTYNITKGTTLQQAEYTID